MRTVWLHARLEPEVLCQDERPAFEMQGQAVKACIQPLSGSAEAKLYGEKATRMLLMLTRADVDIQRGMGVCVSSADGACAYRVAEPPQRWRGHVKAVLTSL